MADEQKELATNVADHGLTGQLPSSNETTEGLGVTQDCSCYITLHNGTDHELVLVYAQEKHGEWKTRPAETVSQKSNIKFWLKDLFLGPGAEGMVKYRIGSTEHKVNMRFQASGCPVRNTINLMRCMPCLKYNLGIKASGRGDVLDPIVDSLWKCHHDDCLFCH
ncbi:hypothetical protein BKA82DRAFT_2427973 [Pisolithus tinctorius]|nr:hypothetical protein BKA82DRAFT_2427973 [Pisolithus tinctorius]